LTTSERQRPPPHKDSAGTAPIGTQPPAGTTAPVTTTDKGNTVPQRVNPTQTAHANLGNGTRKRGGGGSRTNVHYSMPVII